MEIQMIIKTDEPIKLSFRKAIDCFIEGRWPDCKSILKDCYNLKPDDGPTKALYSYLKYHKWKKPSNWSGYKDLRKKINSIA